MTIFIIPNRTKLGNDYVSTDSADVTANSANTAINSIKLGDINTANTILAANQKAYLDSQSFRLNVNTEVVEGNTTTVTGVNHMSEPENITTTYNIFNDLTGKYIVAVGTHEMRQAILSFQSQLLVAAGLTNVDVVDSIPQPRKVQPATTGTQTL
jgi:Ni,Fe-hydrogenase III small subunit